MANDDIFGTLNQPLSNLLDKAVGILNTTALEATQPVDVDLESVFTQPSTLQSTQQLTQLLAPALQAEAPNVFIGSLARRIPQSAFQESLAAQGEARAKLREEQRRSSQLAATIASTSSQLATDVSQRATAASQRETAASQRETAAVQRERARQEISQRASLFPSQLSSAKAQAELAEQQSANYQAEFNLDKRKADAVIAQANQSAALSKQKLLDAQNQATELNNAKTETALAFNKLQAGLNILENDPEYKAKSVAEQYRSRAKLIMNAGLKEASDGNVHASTAVFNLLDSEKTRGATESAVTPRVITGVPQGDASSPPEFGKVGVKTTNGQ